MHPAGRSLSLFAVTATCASLTLLSCGSDSTPAATPDASDGRTYPYTVPNAPCSIVIDHPTELPRYHVPPGTPVDYDSNPPSSGPHYDRWGAYQEVTAPLDERNYVHDLEHGAIVFVYKCADDAGGCTDVRNLFHDAVASLPNDQLCLEAHEGVRVRTVITPDPKLNSPIAAAAWGWTYNAECIDLPSLEDFAKQHYGQGPEQLCGDGQVFPVPSGDGG